MIICYPVLIGHDHILTSLRRAIPRALAHAYCFIGKSGVGKRLVAQIIAAELLQTSVEALSSNPDYIFIRRLSDEKTGKKKKDITIEQAREIRSLARGTAWSGGYRVVIIDEVERLNVAAANALLKLLEEPPAGTVFFLLTENDSFLLPTIRSRCQVVSLPLVPVTEIISGLVVRGIDSLVATSAARWSWGRPGKAIALAENPDQLLAITAEYQEWKNMAAGSLADRLAMSARMQEEKEDTNDERSVFDEKLEHWLLFWGEELETLARGEHPVTTRSLKEVLKAVDAITRARALFRRNVNQRLIMENLLLDF